MRSKARGEQFELVAEFVKVVMVVQMKEMVKLVTVMAQVTEPLADFALSQLLEMAREEEPVCRGYRWHRHPLPPAQGLCGHQGPAQLHRDPRGLQQGPPGRRPLPLPQQDLLRGPLPSVPLHVNTSQVFFS